MARMCDLPPELIGMIFNKIPITSVRTIRSTCKLWDHLSKDWILGKATAARQQFLGFMTMNSMVCSIKFHLCRKEKKDKDLLELSIKQVDLLSHVLISKVFQCYGLLLCVTEDNSRLLVWNPYLGKTRWIEPKTNFHRLDRYVLGYDKKNHNHKILRFLDDYYMGDYYFAYEIYDFSTNSWRDFDIIPDWEIMSYQHGVSLKGNSYFFAKEKIGHDVYNGPNYFSDKLEIVDGEATISDLDDFLLCFDFTRERFGPHLPLPFHSNIFETATLSCVREEQLAVLYQQKKEEILHIWVTTMIEPNAVSWSKFLRVEMKPFRLAGVTVGDEAGSLFIDEEEKVAVVFDVNGYIPTKTTRYHTAFIIGEDRYLKSVSLGKAPEVTRLAVLSEYIRKIYCPQLVCSSSYLPSLVQLKQPRKRKLERDG